MLTLGVGCLVWEGAGTDLGWERVWEGRRGSSCLGGWKVRASWDLKMSCQAAWRAAVVRAHVSIVALVTGWFLQQSSAALFLAQKR